MSLEDASACVDAIEAESSASVAPLPLVDTPPAGEQPVADIDTQIKLAYTAGCEAALAEKPVTANPFERGGQLWIAFDSGYQEANI